MLSGLTVQEQRVLIVLILLIGGGLAVQHYQSRELGDAIQIITKDENENTLEPLVQWEQKQPPPQNASLLPNKININTIDAQTLENAGLYRIGPSHARAIVDYREIHGPFHEPEALLNIEGIGPKTFEAIRDRITVGQVRPPEKELLTPAAKGAGPHDPPPNDQAGQPLNQAPPTPPTRIDINTASAAQLEKLSGIGPVLAREIIHHRTAHGPFRRPEELMQVKGIKENKFAAIRNHITVSP